MEIICVTNDKGGVCKSTICNLITQFAIIAGKKVLVIDTDPQGTLSMEHITRYGQEPTRSEYDPDLFYFSDFLTGKCEFQQTVMGITNYPTMTVVPEDHSETPIFCIAPGEDLANVYKEMSEDLIKAKVEDLVNFLEVSGSLFDYIIIDTPPNKSGVPKELALAADIVIIPSLAERDSLNGTQRTLTTLPKKRKVVIPSRVLQTNLQDQLVEEHEQFSNSTTIVTDPIPNSNLVAKALEEKKSIFISHYSSNVVKTIISVIAKALVLDKEALQGMTQIRLDYLTSIRRKAYKNFNPKMFGAKK
jgi:cellulose biosynthesis protein BcsQ